MSKFQTQIDPLRVAVYEQSPVGATCEFHLPRQPAPILGFRDPEDTT